MFQHSFFLTCPFTQVMPFVQKVATDFLGGATISSERRLGIAVFPGTSQNNDHGDLSGPAKTMLDLTPNLNTVTQMTMDGARKSSDRDAASGLRFPKSGWTYTSMHTGFMRADEALYGDFRYSGFKKVVLFVSDGKAERNKNMGNNMWSARPTYLALEYARRLKDKGTTILGIGYGKKFFDFDTKNCYPLCNGEQLIGFSPPLESGQTLRFPIFSN